jgi:alpha-tubulin suppressor-like RCC1 family protein
MKFFGATNSPESVPIAIRQVLLSLMCPARVSRRKVSLILAFWLSLVPAERSAIGATSGTVVAWGDNFDGQTSVPAGLSGVTAVAAGYAYSVALKSNGTMAAWGYNGFGQTTVPSGLSGISAISAGSSHTVVLKSDGTVVAWGRNDYGQRTVPSGLSGIKAIAGGGEHTVALKDNGTVVAWGA